MSNQDDNAEFLDSLRRDYPDLFGEPAELPPDQAGPVGYTMHLTHLEMIALNRSLNTRLLELRLQWPDGNYPPPVDQTYEITAGVLRRVDKMLGII